MADFKKDLKTFGGPLEKIFHGIGKFSHSMSRLHMRRTDEGLQPGLISISLGRIKRWLPQPLPKIKKSTNLTHELI